MLKGTEQDADGNEIKVRYVQPTIFFYISTYQNTILLKFQLIFSCPVQFSKSSFGMYYVYNTLYINPT